MSKNSLRDPLIESARKAALQAYAPYSRYRVGASFELKEQGNSYVIGCNVENASFGLTICAERVALFKLVSDGIKPGSVRRLCVSARGSDYPYPCGACRQVLHELFDDLEIVLDRGTGKTESVKLNYLLPKGFKLRKARR